MRPEMFESVLGRSFVTSSAGVVFRLANGKAYDRFQLAAIGVPQIKAARYLHLICQRLSITTPAQLAARIGELPTIKGVGHAAFYAALAVLHAEGRADAALSVYSDVAVNRQHHNPGNKEWEPTPVKLATLKRRKTLKPKTQKARR